MASVQINAETIQHQIENCQHLAGEVERQRKDLLARYQQAGQNWHDRHYHTLGNIINECCSVLGRFERELLSSISGLKHLHMAVRQYEDTNITGASQGLDAGSGNSNIDTVETSMRESELRNLYLRQVKQGTVSPLCTFENYQRQYEAIQERIVGGTTSNGIRITGQSDHFMERVIGTKDDPHTPNHRPRSGVSVDAILDALSNPLNVCPPRTAPDGRISQRFIGRHGTVAVNPQTGVLIQCNPTDSDLARRLMGNGP